MGSQEEMDPESRWLVDSRCISVEVRDRAVRGVSFQLAEMQDRKLEAYATGRRTVNVLPFPGWL